MDDLWRTRLSCDFMIRLLAHTFPPSPVSKVSLFFSLSVCRMSVDLRGGCGVGEESNHAISKKPGTL
jgi:hypothetical protein